MLSTATAWLTESDPDLNRNWGFSGSCGSSVVCFDVLDTWCWLVKVTVIRVRTHRPSSKFAFRAGAPRYHFAPSLCLNEGFFLTTLRNCCSHLLIFTFKKKKENQKSLACSGQERFLKSKFRIRAATKLTTRTRSGNQNILQHRFPRQVVRDSKTTQRNLVIRRAIKLP